MPECFSYDEKTGTLTLYSSITTTESLEETRLKPAHVCFARGDWSGKDEIINNILQIVCRGNVDLKSCKLPDGLTKIDDDAFWCCFGLTSITIPNSVTKIGKKAFYYCFSLTSVVIPERVTEIGDGAFSWCKKLTSITIPNSVTKIEKRAFERCINLTSVTIPERVTEIDGWCCSITTIPYSVTKIGEGAFEGCINLTSVTIPESVTEIADFTFSGCSALTGVIIPESVETIGRLAFSNCKALTSVIIPKNVKKIDGGAFHSCVGLTQITFCGDVEYIARDVKIDSPNIFRCCTSLKTIEVCSENMQKKMGKYIENASLEGLDTKLIDIGVVVSQNTQTNPKGSVPYRKTPTVIPPYNNRGR